MAVAAIEKAEQERAALCEAIPKAPSGKILRRVLRLQDGEHEGHR